MASLPRIEDGTWQDTKYRRKYGTTPKSILMSGAHSHRSLHQMMRGRRPRKAGSIRIHAARDLIPCSKEGKVRAVNTALAEAKEQQSNLHYQAFLQLEVFCHENIETQLPFSHLQRNEHRGQRGLVRVQLGHADCWTSQQGSHGPGGLLCSSSQQGSHACSHSRSQRVRLISQMLHAVIAAEAMLQC